MNNFPELKSARLLSENEMLELHGGGKVTPTCSFSCRDGCNAGCLSACKPGKLNSSDK